MLWWQVLGKIKGARTDELLVVRTVSCGEELVRKPLIDQRLNPDPALQHLSQSQVQLEQRILHIREVNHCFHGPISPVHTRDGSDRNIGFVQHNDRDGVGSGHFHFHANTTTGLAYIGNDQAGIQHLPIVPLVDVRGVDVPVQHRISVQMRYVGHQTIASAKNANPLVKLPGIDFSRPDTGQHPRDVDLVRKEGLGQIRHVYSPAL